MIWKNSIIECYYSCSGSDQSEGHYYLKREDGKGNASLHRFKGSIYLEGSFDEEIDREKVEGMWKVKLIK